jgi:hypothetical protein
MLPILRLYISYLNGMNKEIAVGVQAYQPPGKLSIKVLLLLY